MKGLKINVKAAQINTDDVFSLPKFYNEKKIECSKISESIFLSGYRQSIDFAFLENNKITHIINCALSSKGYKPEFFHNIDYLFLDLKDDPGFDIINAIFLGIEFIEKALKENGKIFIHCYEVTKKIFIILHKNKIYRL